MGAGSGVAWWTGKSRAAWWLAGGGVVLWVFLYAAKGGGVFVVTASRGMEGWGNMGGLAY